jgi:regulatory protein spx
MEENKIITFYYSKYNSSYTQAEKWLISHGIEVNRKRVDSITSEDLIHILSLTDNGFHDILKKNGSKKNTKADLRKRHIHLMNFNEGIKFILGNTDLLRSPIIFDEKKLLIGFNSDEIRVFLSKRYG